VSIIKTVIGLWAGYEGGIGIRNIIERHTYYNEAREYCNEVGKPMLRIGMRKYFWEPPDADITVDTNPEVESIAGGICADERNLLFVDKEFGVCINQHTLEHLNSIGDVEKAVKECVRVSDITVLLTPSPYSIFTNVFNPNHNLRLYFDRISNAIRVEENRCNVRSIGQAMVVKELPRIYTKGIGIVIYNEFSSLM